MSRSTSLFAVIAAAATTAVLGLVSAPASASSLTGTEYDCNAGCDLKTLIDNDGYFLVLDKWFGNFKYVNQTHIANPVALPLNPLPVGGLTVTEDPLGADGPGLILGGAMAAISFLEDGLPSVKDFLFGYDVHVHDPHRYITDVHLGFEAIVSGGGFANISESVFEITEDGLTGASLLDGPLSVNTAPDAKFEDWAFLTKPVKWARVEKDIFLFSGDKGSAVTTIIHQRFSQTSVPEPGAVVGLLAIGSFGVSEILKRHKKAK
ncbi:hypothetical protein [Limnofasciculus baicalensis]|uniref:PEP-CTERM sorting domain-containing protein n=1 Tax=Limnofasciculus baicalensis BBK-W-15 TaxID=2699891 RepID=A0AAE3H064_9CYAN|nr:hypothetical protein [Limnofasciculus baicalensis]MCP2731827.1 hypothetical protein [Limnofasciculus baicalensis BBK-W-15]